MCTIIDFSIFLPHNWNFFQLWGKRVLHNSIVNVYTDVNIHWCVASYERLRGRVVRVLCTCSVLLSWWVFASTMLQSSLWPAWDKTLTRYFAMQTGTCMQLQGHGGPHVSSIRFAWLANRLPMSWVLDKDSVPYIIIIIIIKLNCCYISVLETFYTVI